MYETTALRSLAPTYTEYFGRGETMTLKRRKHLEPQYEPIQLDQVYEIYIPVDVFGNGKTETILRRRKDRMPGPYTHVPLS